MPKATALDIVGQVASGPAHLHRLGIAQCDVRLTNVLLVQPFSTAGLNDVKVVYFGLGQRFCLPQRSGTRGTRVHVHGGTRTYMSP